MCSKASRAGSTQSLVGSIVSAVADSIEGAEDCIVGRAWFFR